MPYNVTPTLNLQTTIKGDGERFDQNVLNNNFIKLDSEAAAQREKNRLQDGRLDQIENPTKFQMARFTSRVNGGRNTTLYNQGPITAVADSNIDSSFVTTVNPGSVNLSSTDEPLWVLKRGLYSFTIGVTMSLAVAGRSFTELRINKENRYRFSWGMVGEDSQTWTWNFPVYQDDTKIQFWYYKTATSDLSDVQHTYWMTKVK